MLLLASPPDAGGSVPRTHIEQLTAPEGVRCLCSFQASELVCIRTHIDTQTQRYKDRQIDTHTQLIHSAFTCTLRTWEDEDQESKVIFGYTTSLRPAKATQL